MRSWKGEKTDGNDTGERRRLITAIHRTKAALFEIGELVRHLIKCTREIRNKLIIE